ncbi:MAG: MltA domain-containing protein [Deltaproteobacteria bacterium]|nr:MltA domain-containing protein [Deltaproteobacteria bacterium]
MIRIKVIFIITLIITACARAPLAKLSDAMRPDSAPQLGDDLKLENLSNALSAQIEFFSRQDQGRIMSFGPRKITVADYAAALKPLAEAISAGDAGRFYQIIENNFDFYEVYGQPRWGEVLVTSYYEPVLLGDTTPGELFSQPLYRKPTDLLKLDLRLFQPDIVETRKHRARLDNDKVLPYYSRKEIDSDGALAGRGLEICWVDPVEAFFLHIQGSGTVVLPSGQELRLTYADKNGLPYRSIGVDIRQALPPESKISADVIRNFLINVSAEEKRSYMNKNESYVFFTVSDTGAITSSGIPATAGRTIATDTRFFPKGALAFLEFEKPVYRSNSDPYPEDSEKASRFVIDQDAGGAILGGGRVDLFWGRGDDAGRYAGRVNSRGKLWYLLPKSATRG